MREPQGAEAMNSGNDAPVILDPECELDAVYARRVTALDAERDAADLVRYEEARDIARAHLAKVRERPEDHAS